MGSALADPVSGEYTVLETNQYTGLQRYAVSPPSSLPPETRLVGFRTLIWRVSWAHVRRELLTGEHTGQISQ